jgi:hypothetical protein
VEGIITLTDEEYAERKKKIIEEELRLKNAIETGEKEHREEH